MKILVDTNIIIDTLTGREPFRESAEQIFMLATNQIEDIYYSKFRYRYLLFSKKAFAQYRAV